MSRNSYGSAPYVHAGNALSIGPTSQAMTKILSITLPLTLNTRYTYSGSSMQLIPNYQDPLHAYLNGLRRTTQGLIITTIQRTIRPWIHARGRAFSEGGGDVTIRSMSGDLGNFPSSSQPQNSGTLNVIRVYIRRVPLGDYFFSPQFRILVQTIE